MIFMSPSPQQEDMTIDISSTGDNAITLFQKKQLEERYIKRVIKYVSCQEGQFHQLFRTQEMEVICNDITRHRQFFLTERYTDDKTSENTVQMD